MSTLVGKKAPDFKAKAVIGNKIVEDFSLMHYRGKNVVFFFYPLDFTFVCPTELHAFQEALEEFEKRNTQVIACSVDSAHSHYAWLNTPKSKGGIEGVDYPLVSDINKNISEEYGVLVPGEGIAYRGLFLIDKEGVVRHQVVNDLPLGRSVNEVLRMIDALHHFEQNGEVCPANWIQGKKSMKPNQEDLQKFYANA
ncbi:MAG: peroxiredoxin [Chlamydiota bacterium]|nr:peroxiredoxin [Chlamydiota bacterium]